MYHNNQSLIDTIFNQVEDLLKYGKLVRYPYTHIKTTNTIYTIINKTRKFHDTIKTWNQMNPIQQNWINFKTHFRTSHRNIEETGELTMEHVGFHQSNLVNGIVSHINCLPFTYPPQGCQEPVYVLTTHPIPMDAPMIPPIVQPSPAANYSTNATSNIIPKLLTNMQKIQQLMVQM